MERSRNYATLSLRFFSISGNLFPDIESLRRDVHCDTGKMLRVMITGAGMDQSTFLYQNDVGVKRSKILLQASLHWISDLLTLVSSEYNYKQ